MPDRMKDFSIDHCMISHSLGTYFQRLLCHTKKADFEVHQSGNVDQKENVKAHLFLFIETGPNSCMLKSDLNASNISPLVI